MSGYIYFTDEQKERANSVDLVDFLQRQGEKLLPSGRDKRLARDHSITVRGNRWYDHSAQEGSYAIDLVKRLYDLSFPEAVSLLLGGEQGVEYRQHSKSSESEQRKPFVLPPAHTDMRRVFAYLIKQRCISREVLSEFAREKLLFEDAEYHNAVFVGFDEKGIACHAHKKSMTTDSSFRINVEGSHPAYSFHYISKNPYPHTLSVFEAPIDLLSYISLNPHNWKNASYVALNGVSEQPILKLLELYPQLDHVVLCLDHDVAGIEATEHIYDILMEHGQFAVGQVQSKYKDWNEDLKAKHGFTPIPAEEHPQLLLRDVLCEEISKFTWEHQYADYSANAFRKALKNCRGNPQQIKESLIVLAGLSVLATVKEYKRISHCRDLSTVESRLKYSFKTYQNRGGLENKLSDIGNSLMPLFSCSQIETQSEKQSHAESFEQLASECLKGAVLAELSIQQTAEKKQEQGGLCLS
ncbi:DUF3991 domain-containing protein [Clostridium sp. WB02_MRS01]|uniref:DUF3991 and toprim domain-containing protein n=1 Tax=Clostridium sp. WB02_MRS01 TaxID=2605777 RepID=UPI0012B27206|nr:DUF3991 and toprim domain-containing protein [Clostridium sp. WB02_MRS01]MSS10910.1 DUF3991 domain-containing protein [Clostridium sp. WB02_MRS01]